MRTLRILATTAAAIAAVLTAAPVAANTVAPTPFYADSGDACRYGSTDGTLEWRLATTPGHAVAVKVKGRITDRPLTADPGTVCRDDRYYSIATYTAYNGDAAVDTQARRADNGIVPIEFTLGANSTVARIDRLVIQVCRHSYSLPPSYCGTPATYRPLAG